MSDLLDTRASVSSMLIQAEHLAAVHEEISRLPDRYRRAIILCHLEGLTLAQAAINLRCTSGTVGSLLSRARSKLRAQLANRGFCCDVSVLTQALQPRMTVPLALERSTIHSALIYTTKHSMLAGATSTAAIELASATLKSTSITKAFVLTSSILAVTLTLAGDGVVPARAFQNTPKPAARSQTRDSRPAIPLPQFPRALTQMPAWLKGPAPFDVAAFLASPPPDQNAAPRYLEALFEFGSEVAICFPEGPDREARKQAIDDRQKRFLEVFQAVTMHRGVVTEEKLEATLNEFDTGFRKLDWAQQRPLCVFETSGGVTAYAAHVQTARNVARVAQLRVRQFLEKGEIDPAIRDLKRLLRLSRDLIPRGFAITDLTAAAIDEVSIKQIIIPLLSAPGLTIEQCDRVLELLVEHETQSRDSYSEGLRADYLDARITLHQLVHDQDQLRADAKLIGNNVGPSIVASIAEPDFTAALAPNANQPVASLSERLRALATQVMSLKNVKNLDALIAQTKPEDLAIQVEKLNTYYSQLLESADQPYPARIRDASKLPPSLLTNDLLTRITRRLPSAISVLTTVTAKHKANKHLALSLVAIRRWQLTHKGANPPSLEAAIQQTPIPSIPIDPYDGKSVRYTTINGQPTVYCIGPDGQDNGGKTEARRAADPGDILLRFQ
jgi:hypothetical protein